jgi:hypothetical protein
MRRGTLGYGFSLPPRMTKVQEVLHILKFPDTVERVILVNGRYSESDKKLSPDDFIILFPPMTGAKKSFKSKDDDLLNQDFRDKAPYLSKPLQS